MTRSYEAEKEANWVPIYGPDGEEIGEACNQYEAYAELRKQVRSRPGRVKDWVTSNGHVLTAKDSRDLCDIAAGEQVRQQFEGLV